MEESVVIRLAGTSMVALATAALLGSLSLVAWRQARALEALELLDGLERELALGQAEQADLSGRIQILESRGWVIPEAGEKLGMRVPQASEIVYLAGEGS